MRKRLKLTDFSIYLEDRVHRMLTREGDFDNEEFAQESLMTLRALIPSSENAKVDDDQQEF